MQAEQDPMHLPPLACRIDPHAFMQLLDMAGEALAPSLMIQMHDDLWQIARRILCALDPVDDTALHRQTHILAAIAGSAGAQDLQEAAQELGRSVDAHPPDPALLQHHAAKVLEGLFGLIRYTQEAIQQTRSPD